MATQHEIMTALDSAERRLSAWRERARESTERLVKLTCTLGAAAASGYVDGRWPGRSIGSIRYTTLAGAVLTTAGLAGWAGRQSDVVEALGIGFLAGALHAYGLSQGSAAATAAVKGVGAVRALPEAPTAEEVIASFRQAVKAA